MPISFSHPANRDLGARGAGVTAVLDQYRQDAPCDRAHARPLVRNNRTAAASPGTRGLQQGGGPCGCGRGCAGDGRGEDRRPIRAIGSRPSRPPRDLDVAFLAIDEVQLGADLERGHVFTDRMLNRRGEETLVLGADRAADGRAPPARGPCPDPPAPVTALGEKKITRSPRRSAVVAFSAEEVYSIMN